jgi:ubiquinone/menaquinone biosynthesis C-methylase UbiE
MHELASAFRDRLIDLGEVEDPAFAGILSPEPEVGQERLGVNAEFLEDAEAYYVKHQGFDYWKALFAGAFQRLGITSAPLTVEYGCGFGNSTLPLLDLLPETRIIASDISPNLLAIAKRLVNARNMQDRCLLAAMDAQKPYLKENVADLVVGSAILHHLSEPQLLIHSAVRVLKPKKCAIFFEPFELGYALIRMLMLDIHAEAKRRKEESVVTQWFGEYAGELNLQIARDRLPNWRALDDKWVYPRSVLQKIADDCDAELITYSLEGGAGKFRNQITYVMTNFRPFKTTELPDWAWAMIDRLDNDIFSPASMDDIIVSGAVIFRKR